MRQLWGKTGALGQENVFLPSDVHMAIHMPARPALVS